MSGNIIEVTDENFDDEVMNEEGTVLVDFWAPWCGSCIALMPMVESLSKEFKGQAKFVKVNTEDYPEISERFDISGLPTFYVFKDGEKVDEFEGDELPSKAQLRELVSNHISEGGEESEEESDESEVEEIIINKSTYKNLKEWAEENETSVIEEICAAISYSYEDIEDEELEEVDIANEDGKFYVTLPASIYELLEEEANNNSSEISDEFNLILDEYLSEDDEDEEEEEEDEE